MRRGFCTTVQDASARRSIAHATERLKVFKLASLYVGGARQPVPSVGARPVTRL